MLLKEIIAVYSENHTKPIPLSCQNTELLNVEVGHTSMKMAVFWDVAPCSLVEID
jgi:hypothetical protein